MNSTTLQIDQTNAQDFKNEILTGVKAELTAFAKNLQTNNHDTLLTREETAKMLSISLVTLWQYDKQNILPSYKIGTKKRYKKSEVLAALQKSNNFN